MQTTVELPQVQFSDKDVDENECETLGRRRAEKVYSDLSDSSRR